MRNGRGSLALWWAGGQRVSGGPWVRVEFRIWRLTWRAGTCIISQKKELSIWNSSGDREGCGEDAHHLSRRPARSNRAVSSVQGIQPQVSRTYPFLSSSDLCPVARERVVERVSERMEVAVKHRVCG